MMFLFEKEFGVLLDAGDLGGPPRLDLSDPAVAMDGFVTPAVLTRARGGCPASRTSPTRARDAADALVHGHRVDALGRGRGKLMMLEG